MTDTKTCAHPACSCQVAPGDEFCSEGCRSASSDQLCECGHDDCGT